MKTYKLSSAEKIALRMFCQLGTEMKNVCDVIKTEESESWKQFCSGKYAGMRRAQNLLELQYKVVYEFSDKWDECETEEDYKTLKAVYGIGEEW